MVNHGSVCKFSRQGRRGPLFRLNSIWELRSRKAVDARMRRVGLQDFIESAERSGQEDIPQLLLMGAYLQFRKKERNDEAAMVKGLAQKLYDGLERGEIVRLEPEPRLGREASPHDASIEDVEEDEDEEIEDEVKTELNIDSLPTFPNSSSDQRTTEESYSLKHEPMSLLTCDTVPVKTE